MHSRRNALEYAMKGTYCDPHLQNRNVKLCSHQPSPKETIWFSGIRLDRLPNVSFVSVFFPPLGFREIMLNPISLPGHSKPLNQGIYVEDVSVYFSKGRHGF